MEGKLPKCWSTPLEGGRESVLRMIKTKEDRLGRFGFKFRAGGTHTARTMMLEDLRLLLSSVPSLSNLPSVGATKGDYVKAIMEDNCLHKRSMRTRILTTRHLVELYALDSSVTLFRALLYFWKRDPDSQALLALLCAYCRDPILRLSAPFILALPENTVVSRESLEEFIDEKYPSRFSKATLKSTAQNINSTWTKSGHFHGRTKKFRSLVNPTPGAVSYALFLGYLLGERGNALFKTEYVNLLDCSVEHAIELANQAALKGWIVFKRLGNVIEVLFPNLLTSQEMEWLRE